MTAACASLQELCNMLHIVLQMIHRFSPTRAFSWLKVPTSAVTFKTLLRHYAKQALTPWSLNVKLGPVWLA